MLRDVVVYDHRILRLFAMRHRRETTIVSPNLRTICIILLKINFIYVTGQSGT